MWQPALVAVNLCREGFDGDNTMKLGSQIESGAGLSALVPVEVKVGQLFRDRNRFLTKPIHRVIHVPDDQVGFMFVPPGQQLGLGDLFAHEDWHLADAALIFLKRAKCRRPFVDQALVLVSGDEQSGPLVTQLTQPFQRSRQGKMMVQGYRMVA